MLLTYPDDQIALFEALSLRSIDFFIPRASAAPGDMPAASLTGFLIARRLPPAWTQDAAGARAWLQAAVALEPELFSGAGLRLHDALGAPVGGQGQSACRISVTFPAIAQARVEPEEAEAMTREELRARPELYGKPGSAWSSAERRLSWAIYQRTGQIAQARLWDLARQSLAALNAAAPQPACLPEPRHCPFGWFNPSSIAPQVEAFELACLLPAAPSSPPRSV